jgi:hypothetical protein
MRLYFIPLLLIAHYSLSQSFSVVEIPEFGNRSFEQVKWADYDQDGDPDFIGFRRHSTPAMVLFRNNGDGHFNQVVMDFPYMQEAQFEWADIDNDNDLDILLVGCDSYCGYDDDQMYILRNEGNDFFSRVSHNLPPANGISIADFSSDGNPDVVLYIEGSGQKFFENVGNYTFQKVYETVAGGEIFWVDFNNDGKRIFL